MIYLASLHAAEKGERAVIWAARNCHKTFVSAVALLDIEVEWLTGDEHLGEHLDVDQLLVPEISIRYGVYYLKYLYSKFDYKWDVACAAYNGGEGNVSEWLADSRYSDGEGNLTAYPKSFKETKNYVKKIDQAREMYRKLYY